MFRFVKVATFVGCMSCTIISYGGELIIGSTYDINARIELRSGPGEKFDKKINRKASELLHSTEYLAVDASVTIKVLKLKDSWAEIQVIEPQHLNQSHIGWIPDSYIKNGPASRKMDGWTISTCQVYNDKSLKSAPIGFIARCA